MKFLRNKKAKAEKNKGEEDEFPLRQRARILIEGQVFTAVMTLVTLFALFGDDFRLWFCPSVIDPYFQGCLIFCLFLFTAEVLLNSCMVNDFKWSFFFWLDVVATLSLIVDIPWIIGIVENLLQLNPTINQNDAQTGKIVASDQNSSQVGNIIKSLRLIRLIRIIKLYKYIVHSNKEADEAKLREQQKLSQNAQQAALKRELEPGRLGKTLSDTLTRRLIIGVLLLLMVLPAITYQGGDISYPYGLKKLFWFGRSNCGKYGGDFNCVKTVGDNWISEEGWQEILRQFISSTRPDENTDSLQTILWIYTPDYTKNGMLNSIQNITNSITDNKPYWDDLELIKTIQREKFPSNISDTQWQALQNWLTFDQIQSLQIQDQEFMKLIHFQDISLTNLKWENVQALQALKRNMFPNELYWSQDPNCSGFVVSSNPNCTLRQEEMQLIMYRPEECNNGVFDNCRQLFTYVRLQTTLQSQSDAMLQFLTTIFTCIILGSGAILFQNDTQRIVINPISKMVTIIKTLADDPLQKPEPPQFNEADLVIEKGNQNQMKTVELQKTIYRIGNLLQMSFGQLGAVIIRENVSSGDGSLEVMIPGHRITAIFLVVRINHFIQLTDALKSQIPEFLNKIIMILHKCAEKWDGQANRNECDRYLITWKLPDQETSTDSEKNELLLEQKTEMADKALIATVKMTAELRRAVQFAQYFRRPALYQKFGQNLRPQLSFGLHVGWTIEGAIGSEFKIDAGYMSPHCQIAYRVQELCELYSMQIIVAESLYNIMSLKARHTLRKIDVISMKEFKEPMGIYTFDLSYNNVDSDMIPEDHETGDLIKLAQYETINIESFKNKGVDYMFTLDSDIVGMQQHIHEFNPIFRQAFKSYISGDWNTAFENVQRCLELWDSDGPTKAIERHMQFYRFTMPESWAGCRNIDEEIDLDEINRILGAEKEEQRDGDAESADGK